MSDSSGDKKHLPTDKRRRQAREDGNIVKSQDLMSAAMLLSGLATLWTFGPPACEKIASMMVDALSTTSIESISPSDATNWLLRDAAKLAAIAVPLLFAMFIAGILVNLTQTGFLLSTKKIMPKLSNISPLAGAKRILSIQGVVKLGFGIFKVLIIAAVAYAALRRYSPQIMGLAGLSIPQIASLMFSSLMGTCVWIGGALFVLALLEYAFQKWKHEQDLMMSDQEIRDEMKESEGDPQMAAKRKHIQRQMMMQRAQSEVPNADVVVSNPTELAIAIKYDPTSMPAPVVLAKGAGVLAQKIRRIALENGIPVVERKPLAQVLYKTVDVGDIIPTEQYQAVAEVLRYVYQLQGKDIPKATAA
ncbi:flagellar biosynthesis protein FlhB [Rubripirellula amarantea]|uniref:Flagellar biosynthetic protein FlhB n=1 Tax=Rubripirellula amarantea TaxID=2527999 RepID=A0A5C5WQJ2_9BACT|nr:flagellar biosynthesis protein FlhB [Rubripirellula amarantea]MDA8746172.1 flagellar biosynthesis protein FlhB [Rubripirellula amarantea]TWT53164.1 Flagellar biosynthetic protein FlhB [Rubripirellula amarantea]